MKNINKKAVVYGYLAFFIPSFILIFIGLGIGAISFVFMVIGGYVTAKLSPRHEILNSIVLGCFAAIFSLVTVGIMYAQTEQNYEIDTLALNILGIIFFSLAAPLLGGALRVIQIKKQAA